MFSSQEPLTRETYSTSTSGIVSDNVRSIVIDESKGILYAGTFGGISSYDGTDWETYTTSEGLISDNVFDLHVDASGNLYAATA